MSAESGRSAGAAAGARAIILAAGRGERMRPLTDTVPKPLLQVHGKPLMQWPMEALARGGVARAVVNTAWLGDSISGHFGPRFTPLGQPALLIDYSHEGRDFGGALETAGGIARALPLLADVFWVLAGDVFAPDFAFPAEAMRRFESGGALAHIWLVPNPEHNLKGDFGLAADGRALNGAGPDGLKHTYSTIGLYRKSLFDALPSGNPEGIKAPLAPLLRAAMDNGLITAELHTGAWTDVGTPERLARLNEHKAPPP